jgi:ankyrin repeat protein
MCGAVWGGGGDTSGDTALIYAAANADPDTVILLLERGADPSLETHFGSNAVKQAIRSGNSEVIRLLQKYNR